jgi:flagellar motor component MotA
MHEMIIEGVIAIREGKNPRVIRELLAPFAADSKPVKTPHAAPAAAYAENRKAS